MAVLFISFQMFVATLEKEMATHSSILAWEIPRTEEPGGLQSMGSQRVGHDWATNTFATLHKVIILYSCNFFFLKSKCPKSYSLLTILIFSCSNEGEFDFGSSQNQTSLWQIVFTCKTGWYLWRWHFNKSSFAWMLGLQKLVKYLVIIL